MQPLLVVMGVSGAGKSVVGEAIAKNLGLAYADGDAFHSAANINKMKGGTALTDADREPWLVSIGAWLAEHDESGGVMACSALRRHYRDVLRRAAPRTTFLQLAVDPDLLRERIEGRQGHYMPSSLLASQLATLEPLAPDEPGMVLTNQGATPDQLAVQYVSRLRW